MFCNLWETQLKKRDFSGSLGNNEVTNTSWNSQYIQNHLKIHEFVRQFQGAIFFLNYKSFTTKLADLVKKLE